MMTPKDLRQALPLFENFLERFSPLLVDDHRTESRKERAAAYLRGLLLDAESTKTAESIALKVHGDPSQVRMTQVFLGQSAWADDPLRDELVRWVDQELGSEAGTLIVDESGIPKCGDKSVGVARQYCGATGKIDNKQTDKAFRIDPPMLKAFWTMCFVAGWREWHPANVSRKRRASS